ncbi:hypothetical protein IFR04_000250 [Cadophora malorum]|uniref:HET-domain-containing protein n=1 Tax=Cadophora malorum TaxID=108018 RepID=A0A8H8BX05_9HELO|nr:hypothetical protein IFR04_000250 [Cadophora malorum]
MSLIRLLQRRPDGEIVFREPTSGKPPAYAILSHTWGEDEVIYQDLKKGKDNNKIVNKAGWRKIQFCAKQAAVDGLEYFWVDTCCIDKKSSSELTEAINSMYMWYESAAICYVYLVDLPGGCPRLVETRTQEVITAELVDDDTRVAESRLLQSSDKTHRSLPSQSDLPPFDVEGGTRLPERVWVSRLAGCLWFRRGWTLQELIAPVRLVFFGVDWNFVGSKIDLLYTLSDITGIDSIALSHRCNLEELSIAKRLSWAARHSTTRIEDTAYSLLGLLNINMTLLYGEGERAFTRLQEEIIRRSADSSIFAWLRGADNGLLAPSPAYFGSCSKVILCSGGTVAHSFEFTHRGLKMKLPILKRRSKGGTVLAVLNCRMEDEFERVLCLHLKEQMADPTDSGETTVCSIIQCTLRCAKSQAQDWDATQLHSIDSKELESTEYRTVLLPRHNFQARASTSVLRMMSPVWVKELPPSLQVVEVFPARQWNLETRVMSRYRHLAWNNLTQCGGMLLKHTLQTTVAVCFFIRPGQAFVKILNGSKAPLQKIREDLESTLLSSQVVQQRAVHRFRAMPSCSLIRLQATLELDMCMGEDVWCVVLSQVQTDI